MYSKRLYSTNQNKETELQAAPLYTTEDVQILMGKIFVEQKRFTYLTTKDPFLEKELNLPLFSYKTLRKETFFYMLFP